MGVAGVRATTDEDNEGPAAARFIECGSLTEISLEDRLRGIAWDHFIIRWWFWWHRERCWRVRIGRSQGRTRRRRRVDMHSLTIAVIEHILIDGIHLRWSWTGWWWWVPLCPWTLRLSGLWLTDPPAVETGHCHHHNNKYCNTSCCYGNYGSFR